MPNALTARSMPLTIASRIPFISLAAPTNSFATASINGANSAVNLFATPVTAWPALKNASFTASIFAASTRDKLTPRAWASSVISISAADPLPNVLTRSTPSRPNNSNETRTLSAWVGNPAIASAIWCICSSTGIFNKSVADNPRVSSAFAADPVPLSATSERPRVNRCNELFNLSFETPVNWPACCKPPRASVVIPNLSAVFARASPAAKLDFINALKPATPTRPAIADVVEKTASETDFKPLFTERNAPFVLSFAVISISCFCLAIF